MSDVSIPGGKIRSFVERVENIEGELAELNEQKKEVFAEVQEKKMTAQDTERVVKEKKAKAIGEKHRGAPIGEKFRFVTAKALVTLSFRRRRVTRQDMIAALQEATKQVRAAD